MNDYRIKTIFTITFLNDFFELVQSLNLIIKYNIFLKKKNFLLQELELSNIKKKSGDIAAKTDLINKINESLVQNNKKLKYFEEDYFKKKNKKDQISKTINDYNLKIKNLNKKKKEYFSQINKITRQMEDPNIKGEKFAERIKLLQNKARDSQYEIKEIKLKSNELKFKLNEISPSYEILEKNYQDLLKIIKNDEVSLKAFQNELKEKVKEIENIDLSEFDFNELKSLKPPEELNNELQLINNELNRISELNSILDINNPKDLSKVYEQISRTNAKIKKKINKIVISPNIDKLISCIKNFRRLEELIRNFEILLNNFLETIKLKCQFQIILSDDNRSFLIELQFIRSGKEYIKFNDLTTPEKTFFVITLFITIQIQIENSNIIFSNLFIPTTYNKRGSVFRTIQKILPIFQENENLTKFSLTCIVSKLEMKKPIENLKIIKIEGDNKENDEK